MYVLGTCVSWLIYHVHVYRGSILMAGWVYALGTCITWRDGCMYLEQVYPGGMAVCIGYMYIMAGWMYWVYVYQGGMAVCIGYMYIMAAI